MKTRYLIGFFVFVYAITVSGSEFKFEGATKLQAGASAPADATVNTSNCMTYLDESANEVYIKCIESDGVSAINKTITGVPAGGLPTIGTSTDNAVTRWDGITGVTVQNSTVTIDDTGNTLIPGTAGITGISSLIGGTKTDGITEYTLDAGVTIEEIKLEDNEISSTTDTDLDIVGTGTGTVNISDADFKIENATDATKAINFSASGITGGNVSTLTALDKDYTIEETGHKTKHENGGTDEINVTGLSGELADEQNVNVLKDGVSVGTRTKVNFTDINNTIITITDNATDDRVNIEISTLNNYLKAAHQTDATADGGTITSGSWAKRIFNVACDTISGASVVTDATDDQGQITLPSGLYSVSANTSCYTCGTFQTRLYNVTDASTVTTACGSVAYADTNHSNKVTANSSLIGIIDISDTKVFELQQRCSDTVADDGQGKATGWDTKNTFSTINIIRIGD